VSKVSLNPITTEFLDASGRIERAVVRSCQDDYELLLCVRRPSPRQVEAVRRGVAEVALVVEDPAILIVFRFGDAIPWTVACYERDAGACDRGENRPHPSARPERRAHLDVSLIDAERDVVAMTRSVVLWLDFTRRLDAAVFEQARISFDPSDWKRAKTRVDRRFPTPEILAAHSEIRIPGCS
jgi:hypothetical protein